MATEKKLPPDPEEMNDKRAGWGGQVVEYFMSLTGCDQEDAVCDLIPNLHHWCDRNGLDFNNELRRGIYH